MHVHTEDVGVSRDLQESRCLGHLGRKGAPSTDDVLASPVLERFHTTTLTVNNRRNSPACLGDTRRRLRGLATSRFVMADPKRTRFTYGTKSAFDLKPKKWQAGAFGGPPMPVSSTMVTPLLDLSQAMSPSYPYPPQERAGIYEDAKRSSEGLIRTSQRVNQRNDDKNNDQAWTERLWWRDLDGNEHYDDVIRPQVTYSSCSIGATRTRRRRSLHTSNASDTMDYGNNLFVPKKTWVVPQRERKKKKRNQFRDDSRDFSTLCLTPWLGRDWQFFCNMIITETSRKRPAGHFSNISTTMMRSCDQEHMLWKGKEEKGEEARGSGHACMAWAVTTVPSLWTVHDYLLPRINVIFDFWLSFPHTRQ